jgi:hypothetical protein
MGFPIPLFSKVVKANQETPLMMAFLLVPHTEAAPKQHRSSTEAAPKRHRSGTEAAPKRCASDVQAMCKRCARGWNSPYGDDVESRSAQRPVRVSRSTLEGWTVCPEWVLRGLKTKNATCSGVSSCAPTGIRIPVLALRGPRPGPLDDGFWPYLQV